MKMHASRVHAKSHGSLQTVACNCRAVSGSKSACKGHSTSSICLLHSLYTATYSILLTQRSEDVPSTAAQRLFKPIPGATHYVCMCNAVSTLRDMRMYVCIPEVNGDHWHR